MHRAYSIVYVSVTRMREKLQLFFVISVYIYIQYNTMHSLSLTSTLLLYIPYSSIYRVCVYTVLLLLQCTLFFNKIIITRVDAHTAHA